jgi:hypothetical protein
MFTKIIRKLLLLAFIPLLLIGFVPTIEATPPTGGVTIETEIDFATFSGTFVVTAGPVALNCWSGTFQDHFRGFGAIEKVFTCLDGGTGTFTFLFKPSPSPGPGDANGHWQAWKATGDFFGLRGQGDFSVLVFVEPPTEMLTGVIHYDP